MADYIDRNILCQAYVHIEIPNGFSTERIAELRTYLEDFAAKRGSFFIYPDVRVDVVFKDGSLKSYLTIAGCLYAAIAGYGSFRTGVDYLYTDIKRLSDTLVGETLFMAQARHKDVIRTEARVGIIGSLKEFVDHLNELEDAMGKSSIHQITLRINNLQKEAERLIQNVKDPRDANEIETEMEKTVWTIPENPPYPKGKKPKTDDLFVYREARLNIRKRFIKRK